MIIIKNGNKYVTMQGFDGYKLTENINFAYIFETKEEAEAVAKFMELKEFEIVKL